MAIATYASHPAAVVPIIGRSYQALDVHKDTFVLCEGRRGTSKTISILLHLIKRARANPNTHWLLTRWKRTLLADSVLRTLYEQVLPCLRIPLPSANRFSVMEIPVGNGSMLIPRGLDELSRMQSAEYAGGYLAEGVEMSSRRDVESLAGALRQGGVDYHQLIVDCNPWAPNHWLNEVGEEPPAGIRSVNNADDYVRLLRYNLAPVTQAGRWKRIITHWADNPGYWRLSPWGPTEVGAEYIRKTLGPLTGSLRRQWFDGEWAAAEGGVFPEFDEQVHVVDDFDPPDNWPVITGLDPGYGTTAWEWMAKSPAGNYFVFDEIYAEKQDFAEKCRNYNQRNRVNHRAILREYGDPNEILSNRDQGISIQRQAREHGIRLTPWPADKGAGYEAGVTALRTMLCNARDGRPGGLFVCRRCKGLISNFQNWSFKRNSSGEMIDGAERYEGGNDHGVDVARGLVSSGFLQKWTNE